MVSTRQMATTGGTGSGSSSQFNGGSMSPTSTTPTPSSSSATVTLASSSSSVLAVANSIPKSLSNDSIARNVNDLHLQNVITESLTTPAATVVNRPLTFDSLTSSLCCSSSNSSLSLSCPSMVSSTNSISSSASSTAASSSSSPQYPSPAAAIISSTTTSGQEAEEAPGLGAGAASLIRKRASMLYKSHQSLKEHADIYFESSNATSILDMPSEIIMQIFSYLDYKTIGFNREVCSRFNKVGTHMLNTKFTDLIKVTNTHFQRIKSMMPRRESARRNHPLACECDIVETCYMRLSLLQMTLGRHIERGHCCFFPGSILDEVLSILEHIRSTPALNRPYRVTDELFDLSTMAMEYFREHIEPTLPGISNIYKAYFQTLANAKKAPTSVSSDLAESSATLSTTVPPQSNMVLRKGIRKIKEGMKIYNNQLSVLRTELSTCKRKANEQAKQIAEQQKLLNEQQKQALEYANRLDENDRKNEEMARKFSTLLQELNKCKTELQYWRSKSPAIPICVSCGVKVTPTVPPEDYQALINQGVRPENLLNLTDDTDNESDISLNEQNQQFAFPDRTTTNKLLTINSQTKALKRQNSNSFSSPNKLRNEGPAAAAGAGTEAKKTTTTQESERTAGAAASAAPCGESLACDKSKNVTSSSCSKSNLTRTSLASNQKASTSSPSSAATTSAASASTKTLKNHQEDLIKSNRNSNINNNSNMSSNNNSSNVKEQRRSQGYSTKLFYGSQQQQNQQRRHLVHSSDHQLPSTSRSNSSLPKTVHEAHTNASGQSGQTATSSGVGGRRYSKENNEIEDEEQSLRKVNNATAATSELTPNANSAVEVSAPEAKKARRVQKATRCLTSNAGKRTKF